MNKKDIEIKTEGNRMDIKMMVNLCSVSSPGELQRRFRTAEIEKYFANLRNIGCPEKCIDELKNSWGVTGITNSEYCKYCYIKMYEEVMSRGREHFSMEEMISKVFLANNFPVFWEWSQKK